MGGLTQATLTPAERAVLARFIVVVRERLGDDLYAMWLFGSRARGEPVDDLSDIDLLIITEHAGWDGSGLVYEALDDAARAVALPEVAWTFSIHVQTPAWLRGRRAVASFFIAEVDRDRIEVIPTRA